MSYHDRDLGCIVQIRSELQRFKYSIIASFFCKILLVPIGVVPLQSHYDEIYFRVTYEQAKHWQENVRLIMTWLHSLSFLHCL